jgi:hypothetical protein
VEYDIDPNYNPVAQARRIKILREKLVTQAISGALMFAPRGIATEDFAAQLAISAVKVADAVIAELEKQS